MTFAYGEHTLSVVCKCQLRAHNGHVNLLCGYPPNAPSA
jgi:hypothetical protein